MQEAFERYKEEISDVQETIELATLDKEMAEEKVSLLICVFLGKRSVSSFVGHGNSVGCFSRVFIVIVPVLFLVRKSSAGD